MDANAVQQETGKMIGFIKNEAQEKAREIKVKADEEFNIEKAKLIREETIHLDQLYEKKKKQASIQRKIQESNLNNKQRLKVLQAKNGHLEQLMQTIRQKLSSVSSQSHYKDLLKNLILQSFSCLLESEVEVQCLVEDQDVIKEVLPIATQEFEKMSKIKVEYVLNAVLDSSSVGGIIVTALNGRIKALNTLEHRLVCMTDQVFLFLFSCYQNYALYCTGPRKTASSLIKIINH
eukprot:NODE_165_length_16345_cov_0.329743.p5 type:complete len:234 gc:universal NODE_165_length_16345_cov_0.329743:15791-15090(-)